MTTRSEVEAHNVRRIFAIAEILSADSRAALAGRFFAEFVSSKEGWEWFRHQLSAEEVSRLKQFVDG